MHASTSTRYGVVPTKIFLHENFWIYSVYVCVSHSQGLVLQGDRCVSYSEFQHLYKLKHNNMVGGLLPNSSVAN